MVKVKSNEDVSQLHDGDHLLMLARNEAFGELEASRTHQVLLLII